MEEVESIIARWAGTLMSNPGAYEGYDSTVLLIIKGSTQASWLVDLSSNPSIQETHTRGVEADCILSISEKNFLDIAQGGMTPQVHFLSGNLDIQGDPKAAHQFCLALVGGLLHV